MLSNATPSPRRPKAYGPFYVRSFVSLMMIAFLALFTLSGAALFVSPSGQMANTLGWTLVGLSKGQWETLHIAFGLLWIPLSLLHLVFNWRVIVGYLRDRVHRTFVWRRELLAALLVTAGLGVASVMDLPPVAQLMAWEESFNDVWARRSPDIVATAGSVAAPASGALGGAVPGGAVPGDAVPGGVVTGGAGAGTALGGGMGRYAIVDPATGVAQPVGKEAAARAAAVESAIDQHAAGQGVAGQGVAGQGVAGQGVAGEEAAGDPGQAAADPDAAVEEGPIASE